MEMVVKLGCAEFMFQIVGLCQPRTIYGMAPTERSDLANKKVSK